MAQALITSEIGGRDLQFLTEALDHGKAQLHLTELALARGQSEKIKALGEMLAATQAEENKKLIRIGALKGVGLPTAESTWNKALNSKLAGLSGPKFEKRCLQQLVEVNQRAVTAYETAARPQDTDIKAFVEQGLPLAREKLQFASRMSGTGISQGGRPAETK